jgi:maleate isomerase
MVGKPCIPINIATAWHAVRGLGVTDRIVGRGRLFEEF